MVAVVIKRAVKQRADIFLLQRLGRNNYIYK